MIQDISIRLCRRCTILLPTLLLLAACGIYEHEWTCPMPDGTTKCQSLEQAYASAITQSPIPPPVDPTRLAPPPEADWTPPVKLIWIAPYLDTGGHRHEAALVRVVVFPGAPVTKPEPEFLIPPVPETSEEGGLTTPPSPPPAPDSGRGTRSPMLRPSPGGSRSGGSSGFAIPGS